MSSSAKQAVAEGGADGSKRSWPEVVGLSVEEAKKVILHSKPDAEIIVLPTTVKAVTGDYQFNRVRAFVDTVAQAPHVG